MKILTQYVDYNNKVTQTIFTVPDNCNEYEIMEEIVNRVPVEEECIICIDKLTKIGRRVPLIDSKEVLIRS